MITVDFSERNERGTPIGVSGRKGLMFALIFGNGVGVEVGVPVGVMVGVLVGVLVEVPVAVFVGVFVIVDEGIRIVAVGRIVLVNVTVAVGLAVGTNKASLGTPHEPSQNSAIVIPVKPAILRSGTVLVM